MSAVRLRIINPEVAGRDCRKCHEFVFDPDTGRMLTQDDGVTPLRWPKGKGPPCRTWGESCPKGTPEDSKDFTDQNWQAFLHFLGCEAMHDFPKESRVIRNAKLIAYARDQAEIEKQWLAERMDRLHQTHLAEMLSISLRARLQ